MAPRGSPMAANTAGRGAQAKPRPKSREQPENIPGFLEESRQVHGTIYFCFLRLCKRGREREGPAATGEELGLKRKADIARNHTTPGAGASAEEPTALLHARAGGTGSHRGCLSPQDPLNTSAAAETCSLFSFPIKKRKGRKEAPKPSPVLPSWAAASQQRGRRFTLLLPNSPGPAEGARGLFAAGLDGRSMKAEPRLSIIYHTFLFLSDLS